MAQQQKARFTAFSGWEMPVQYLGLKSEHQAVRSQAGMFDISHMGKFRLVGNNLIETLQTLVPSDLARLQPGQAHQGKTKTGQERGIAIVNAGTTAKDKDWLESHLEGSAIVMEDISNQQALIALQGPQAENILQSLVTDDLKAIAPFEHKQITIEGQTAFIARTGYTGEDGFEIMLEPESAQKLWTALLEAGVVSCGLGARDTLRLEAAMSLYGQDIDETTTPLEAGLGWLVHLNSKGDFIGRSVLEAQKSEGLKSRLVGLQMEGRYIARHDYPIVFEGKKVGKVTSGTLAPTVGKAIALGYVPQSLSKVGQQLEVEIRGKTYPFYRSPHKK